MGLYWDTHVLYGCPVSPSIKKIKRRLKAKKLGEKLDCLIVDGACFVGIARTKKLIVYKQSGLQLACTRVKMADLEECATTYPCSSGQNPVRREDFVVTDEEKKDFAEFIGEFVKPEHKNEALAKTGYYMVETFFTMYNSEPKELIAARPIDV